MRIMRVNRMGYTFILTEEAPEQTRLAFNENSIVVNVSLEEMSRRWYLYQYRGISIQFAFDNLKADEREFIITGILPEDWNRIFKDA